MSNKALRVALVNLGKNSLSLGVNPFGLSVVNGSRRHQADPAMPVVMVVPIEEGAAELARLDDVAKPVRETRPVLERLKLSFRVGVVG